LIRKYDIEHFATLEEKLVNIKMSFSGLLPPEEVRENASPRSSMQPFALAEDTVERGMPGDLIAEGMTQSI